MLHHESVENSNQGHVTRWSRSEMTPRSLQSVNTHHHTYSIVLVAPGTLHVASVLPQARHLAAWLGPTLTSPVGHQETVVVAQLVDLCVVVTMVGVTMVTMRVGCDDT
jgi:hypothetical protein